MRAILVGVVAAVIGMLSVVSFAKEYTIPLYVSFSDNSDNQIFQDHCRGQGTEADPYHCDLAGDQVVISEAVNISESGDNLVVSAVLINNNPNSPDDPNNPDDSENGIRVVLENLNAKIEYFDSNSSVQAVGSVLPVNSGAVVTIRNSKLQVKVVGDGSKPEVWVVGIGRRV